MPINFSELVDKIDQRNRQNREQAWGQIAPFLDVMTRKATYEYEKQKAKDETAAGLKVAGDAMGMKDYAADTSLTPDMQKFIFNIDAEKQAPIKQWEAFSNVFGVKAPDNLKDMTPEMATVSLGKAKDDYAVNEAIKIALDVNPEIAKKVFANDKFVNGDTKTKRAILDKELGDADTRKAFEAQIALAKEKANISVNEYWRTTGSMQQQKLDAANTGQPKMTQGQVQAISRKKLYETNGINLSGYKVKVEEQAGNKVATTLINGKAIKKTPNGYYRLDDDGKWRQLIVDPEDKDSLRYKQRGWAKDTVYKNAAKALNSALTDYDLQTSKSLEPLAGDGEQQTTATPTANPENDQYFPKKK